MKQLLEAVKSFDSSISISQRKLGKREYVKFETVSGDKLWVWLSDAPEISVSLNSVDADDTFAELLNLVLEYFDTSCRVFRHKIVSKYFLCNLKGKVISDITALQKSQIPVSRFDGKSLWDLVEVEYNLAPLSP